MTDKMAVLIIEADSQKEAKEKAYQEVNCYNNQYLFAIPEDSLTAEEVEDWKELSMSC